MTNRRTDLLDRVVREQGFENPITLTIFALNEEHPESQYDEILDDTYRIMSNVLTIFDQMDEINGKYEFTLEEPEEEEAFVPDVEEDSFDYSPFDGQIMFDDIEF